MAPKRWAGVTRKVLAQKVDRFRATPSDGDGRFGFGPTGGTEWVTERCPLDHISSTVETWKLLGSTGQILQLINIHTGWFLAVGPPGATLAV
jgi:hypothetical protein